MALLCRVFGALMMVGAMIWLFGARTADAASARNEPYAAQVDEMMPGRGESMVARGLRDSQNYALALILCPAFFVAGAVLLGSGVVAGAIIGEPAKGTGEALEDYV